MAAPLSPEQIEQFLSRLEHWYDEHARRLSSHTHTDDGFPLGEVARVLQRRYRRGTLNADIITRLERFPLWTWSPREAAFEQHLRSVRTHLGARGTSLRLADLPQAERVWVQNVRAAWRHGKLSAERAQQIVDVCPAILSDARQPHHTCEHDERHRAHDDGAQ